MPIMSQSGSGKEFEPAPEGKTTAVICDVIDKGYEDTPWGPKNKIQIRWQIDALNEEGRPYLVIQSYTNSLYKGSNLRALIENMTGKNFTKDAPDPFDLEAMIGKSCVMLLVHKVSQAGRTYALPKSVMPADVGLDIKDYTRDKDKVDGSLPVERVGPVSSSDGFVPFPVEEPPPHTDADNLGPVDRDPIPF